MPTNLQTLKAKEVSNGKPPTTADETRSETAERCDLNRLLGLPPRQFYPAFRVSLEQVRAAREALLDGDKYAAEKILYPRAARPDGLQMLAMVSE